MRHYLVGRQWPARNYVSPLLPGCLGSRRIERAQKGHGPGVHPIGSGRVDRILRTEACRSPAGRRRVVAIDHRTTPHIQVAIARERGVAEPRVDGVASTPRRRCCGDCEAQEPRTAREERCSSSDVHSAATATTLMTARAKTATGIANPWGFKLLWYNDSRAYIRRKCAGGAVSESGSGLAKVTHFTAMPGHSP